MAEDAIALLDALGIERALLLGHDWGGWIGFLAVALAPGAVDGLRRDRRPAPVEHAAHVLRTRRGRSTSHRSPRRCSAR